MRDDDQRGNIGPLSTSQFIGLTSVVLGLALFVALFRRYRRDPRGLRLWEIPVAAPAGPPAALSGAQRAKRRNRR